MTVEVLEPIVPGTAYPLRFEFFDDDGVGEVQTGNSVRVVIKANPDDADADELADVTAAAGSGNTYIDLTLSKDITKLFPEGSKVYMQANHLVGGVPFALTVQEIETKNAVIDPATA
jgi:hypothetical protein